MAESEDQLLEKALQGDVGALSALLERHGPSVRTRLEGEIAAKWRSMLSVDDVMQQTYTDAFLTIRGFEHRQDSTFKNWLITLARRNLLDAVRMLSTQKRGGDRLRIEVRGRDESMVALYEQLACPEGTPSSHAAHKEAQTILRETIDRLPVNHRRVIWLYDIEGTPVEDVAVAMEKSVGAVYMLRARAHDRLRELMGAAHNFLSERG